MGSLKIPLRLVTSCLDPLYIVETLLSCRPLGTYDSAFILFSIVNKDLRLSSPKQLYSSLICPWGSFHLLSFNLLMASLSLSILQGTKSEFLVISSRRLQRYSFSSLISSYFGLISRFRNRNANSSFITSRIPLESVTNCSSSSKMERWGGEGGGGCPEWSFHVTNPVSWSSQVLVRVQIWRFSVGPH